MSYIFISQLFIEGVRQNSSFDLLGGGVEHLPGNKVFDIGLLSGKARTIQRALNRLTIEAASKTKVLLED